MRHPRPYDTSPNFPHGGSKRKHTVRRRSRRGAFTLVELLVAIAIIIALLAILLPSLGKAIGAANEVLCASNQKQLHTAALSYAADNFGALPPSHGIAPQVTIENSYTGSARGSNWWWYPEWWAAYQPDHDLQYCPDDVGFPNQNPVRFPKPLKSYPDYDYNSYYLNIGDAAGWRSIAGRRLTTLPRASQTVLFAEWPAIVGFSWHRGLKGGPQVVDAVNIIAFADGHVAPTEIYWDGITDAINAHWAFRYNPPSDYNYVWDPFNP